MFSFFWQLYSVLLRVVFFCFFFLTIVIDKYNGFMKTESYCTKACTVQETSQEMEMYEKL